MSPTQSVELMLEPLAEQRVRRDWQALIDAGLPSQARHRSPSNRPHITLVAVRELPIGADARLPAQVGSMPVVATWGPVVEFGDGPWTVVRLVEPSAGMRALQSRMAAVCEVPDDTLTAPSRWTPHVTLARRVGADVRAAVHAVLAAEAHVAEPEAAEARAAGSCRRGAQVRATGVRRWDGAARREWTL